MKSRQFAVIGAGFWFHYPVAAWKEIDGVSYHKQIERALARGRKD